MDKEKSQVEIINNFLNFSKTSQFNSLLAEDFNKLKDLTSEIRNFNLKPTIEGEKEHNKKKNRYRDILPYDESRVKLDYLKTDEESFELGSDYINANFITNVLDGYYKYIAAQGPNKETVVDFVRMLVQYNVKIVICACNEFEGQRLKCHRYWTDDCAEGYQFYKNYIVTLKSEPIVLEDCIIRNLKIRYIPNLLLNTQSNHSIKNNDTFLEYEFTQYHLINWPDHGVPDNIQSIINIINLVRNKMIENNRAINENFSNNYKNHNVSSKKFHIPLSNDYLCVHCSAGCGRTGTIIAIDQLWTMINENKLPNDFTIYEIARSLREQRIAMIQTLSQYQFFARATCILFEKYLETLENRNNHEYKNLPVKSNLNSKIIKYNSQEPLINKTNSPVVNINTNRQETTNRKVDSNNNNLEDYKDENKNMDLLNNLITPPKSPRTNNINSNKTKHSTISKYVDTPLTTVKQKINRLVPNVFNIFSTTSSNNSTPNNTSVLNTPISISSASSSSSPSPISLSSNTSSNSSANKASKLNSNKQSKLIDSSSNEESLSIKIFNNYNNNHSMKQDYKLSTPKSIDSGYKQDENTHSSQFLRSNSSKKISNMFASRARSVSRIETSNTTPIKTNSPKYPRKLSQSSSSDKSTEFESITNQNQLQYNPDIGELYINDKSLYKKEPGSGCEFLSNRLNMQQKYQLDLQNNNLPKSLVNNNNIDNNNNNLNDLTPLSKSSINFKTKTIRIIHNPNSNQDSLPPKKPSEDALNHDLNQEETPKAPLRTKNKRFNLNLNSNFDHNQPLKSHQYKIIDIDINTPNDSNQIQKSNSANQNKLVEIRLNRSARSGVNFDGSSNNNNKQFYSIYDSDMINDNQNKTNNNENYNNRRLNQHYRNGILINMNNNSQEESNQTPDLSQQQNQFNFKSKSPKYDMLTLPNKRYIQSPKLENQLDNSKDDNFVNPFPYNPNKQSNNNKFNKNISNLTINKNQDLNINFHYPNRNNYYYFLNNLHSNNNRKSLKIETQLQMQKPQNEEYYDNAPTEYFDNFDSNKNNPKRRSTQIFNL